MVDQAKVNGRESGTPASDMGEGIADLAHDLLSLAELQYQLLVADVREGGSRTKVPIAVIAVSAILALASLPVALLGVGWLLVNRAGFSEGAAFLITAACALVIAGGMAFWAYRRLQGAVSLLARSRAELAANIYWIKQALKRRKTAPRGDGVAPARY